MTAETFAFQAEVSKLLDIVAHSLYSQKEIFLRELVSNASDACDKLRYESLTKPALIEGDSEFKITLGVDKKKKTLTVSDNGIGMSKDDLTELLGTIARSGTQAFAEAMKTRQETKQSDGNLIGQFGVGFYSAFMVADEVTVITRRAGGAEAWKWVSDGKGEYTIEAAERSGRGTDIVVKLKKEAKEYLESHRLRHIIKTYSDHIAAPIILTAGKDDGEDQTLNTASALWTRERKDITDEQYKEFYHHVGGGFDEPWMTLHNKVEGVMSYTNLLFIPSSQPFDLFNPDRKGSVKLYVKRIFITGDAEGVLPSYLRFVKGVIDSEDLPLNISREMMQHDPRLAKIQAGLVRRVLNELKKSAEKKPEEYAGFWENFGAVLKEGVYEDFTNREKILDLVRFKSSAGDGLVSLKQYVERMREGQDAIYYITGEDARTALNSPQLEGFRAKGVEVLLMTDPVDEFWLSSVGVFDEKPLKSATRGDADLSGVASGGADKHDEKKDDDAADENGLDALLAKMKVALGEKVKDVRASKRLTSSAVCLVADEGDMDMNLERLLKRHKQLDGADGTPRVLEVNPGHALIKKLARKATGEGAFTDEALLLLDQARILEGETVLDAPAFAARLSKLMEAGA